MAAIQDITRELVFSLLPPRAPESHKGNYGKVLAVCGCAEYPRGSPCWPAWARCARVLAW